MLTYAFANFLVSTAVLGTLKGASAVYAPTTFLFPYAVAKRWHLLVLFLFVLLLH